MYSAKKKKKKTLSILFSGHQLECNEQSRCKKWISPIHLDQWAMTLFNRSISQTNVLVCNDTSAQHKYEAVGKVKDSNLIRLVS